MADLADERINIQQDEVKYRAAVSEVLLTRVGSAINFINNKQYKHFEFGFLKAVGTAANPTYAKFSPPLVISDFEAFPTNSEIVGIEVEHDVTGSSGTSELDIEWSTQNSGTWSTIFSTTPKVASTAPNDAQFDTFGNASTPTGCTVPVLSKSTFNAGDRIRCKCLSLMAGTPNGFKLTIFYRPI